MAGLGEPEGITIDWALPVPPRRRGPRWIVEGIYFLDTVTSRLAGGGMNALAARDRAVLEAAKTAETEVEVGKKDAVSQLPFSPVALRLLRRVQDS